MSRTAVVLGVGRSAGLGAALCRRFADEGLQVFAAGRSEQKLERVVGEIARAGGNAVPVVIDATVEEDVIRLFDTVEGQGGAPEVVVYNAGNNEFRPLLEMDAQFWEGLWRLCCFMNQLGLQRLSPQ